MTTEYPTWLQVLANALGVDVIPLEMKRATLRGTALIALDVLDPDGERALPPFGEPYEYQPEHEDYYAAVRAGFDETYDALVK